MEKKAVPAKPGGLYDFVPPPSDSAHTGEVTASATEVAEIAQGSSSAEAEMRAKMQLQAKLRQQQARAAAAAAASVKQTAPKHTAQRNEKAVREGESESATTAEETKAKPAMAADETWDDDGIADAYDPTRPNDYDEYCRNRIAAMKRGEMVRRAREEDEKKAPTATNTDGTRAIALDLNITGEEAYRRRLRMSGKEVPPTPPQPSETTIPVKDDEAADDDIDGVPWNGQQPTETTKGTAATAARTEKVAPIQTEPTAEEDDIDGVPWEPVSSSEQQQVPTNTPKMHPKAAASPPRVGAKIMEKMGWQEGTGLGKLQQGPTAPLVVKRDAVNSACGDILPPKDRGGVVMLTGMVNPEEVDGDLSDEVAEECRRFGVVDRVVVHTLPVGGMTTREESVRIFVKFKSESSAAPALADLDGRFFGGRVVKAKRYDVRSFDGGELSK